MTTNSHLSQILSFIYTSVHISMAHLHSVTDANHNIHM